jgi:hypothetical protein
MRWQDIIQLSDQDLQDKGVAALGARRKMIKVFQTVQDHCKTNVSPILFLFFFFPLLTFLLH